MVDRAVAALAGKSTEAMRQHVADLLRAITGMVQAVGRSPSDEVRKRAKELPASLREFKALNDLIAAAYGRDGGFQLQRLEDESPDLVSDEKALRSRDASSSGTGRRW